MHQSLQEWIYQYVRDNGFIKTCQIDALKKFLGVKDIEKEIYDTVVKTCNPNYLEGKRSTISTIK